MATYKAKLIKLPDGNLYEIVPPSPTSTERGGVIASTKSSTGTAFSLKSTGVTAVEFIEGTP